MRKALGWAVVVWGMAACGGDGEVAADALDASVEIADGDEADGAADEDVATDPGDGQGDAPDVAAPTCPPAGAPAPRPEPDPSRSRFAMSLFHYNIEYVPGGLEGVDEAGEPIYVADLEAVHGWDNDAVEDWIVRETLEPILDIYLRHPTWGVNLEMQGYMVEVMAARHPDVLDKLRELAWAGQAELISFHYAAQLFLAYPAEDLARSIARTREVFEEHCLPLSDVVFNQEGQAGEGRQRMAVEQGYEVGVYPKNLFLYQYQSAQWWPWYESEGGTLIVGPGGVDPASGVEVAWDFFDDGELRAVLDGVNPYLAFLGGADEARVAEFEAKLAAREAAGFAMATIGDYVRHLEAKGVEKKPAPPLLDGTWQAKSTDSIHRWLGGASDVWHPAEEDNRVRTGNAVARMHVAATQVLVEHAAAEGVDVTAAEVELATLWKDVFHAEVSDASGVNPWRGEVLWSLRLNDSLMERSAALRATLLSALGTPHALVDLAARAVTPLEDLPMPEPLEETTAPLEVAVTAPGRSLDMTWLGVGEGRHRLQIAIGAAGSGEPCEGCDPRLLRVDFPRTEDVIAYSPGLIEDEVRSYDLGAFDLQRGEVYLPLANGLIGLGDGWWAIKHVRHVHVAARVAPADATIGFIDETQALGDGAFWVFEVVQGDAAEALAIANRLNLTPVVTY